MSEIEMEIEVEWAEDKECSGLEVKHGRLEEANRMRWSRAEQTRGQRSVEGVSKACRRSVSKESMPMKAKELFVAPKQKQTGRRADGSKRRWLSVVAGTS